MLPLVIPDFYLGLYFDSFLTYVVTKAVLSRMGQKLEKILRLLRAGGF